MSEFLWLTGIENSSLPELGVDELAMTGHYTQITKDLSLAAETGVKAIRYGLPWALLEPERYQYQWALADEAVGALDGLGISAVWDLVHFGCPSWLADGFLNPQYPECVAQFAREIARRYPSLKRFTPFNEPYICAYFRGGNGTWPPYELSFEGFVRQLVPLIEGVRTTVAALHEVRPEIEIWLNDGADEFRCAAGSEALEALAFELTNLRFLPLDILLGKTTTDSASWRFLTHHGVDAGWLQECVEKPCRIDVVGIDYYPGSEHEIYLPLGPKDPGDWGRRSDFAMLPQGEPVGILTILRTYCARYRRPLYLAETSSTSHQEAWLEYCVSEVSQALDEGLPVVGLTWWPLFDHVDWDSGLTRLQGHVSPSGLWHGKPTSADRDPGSLVGSFRKVVKAGRPVSSGLVPFPVKILGLPIKEPELP